MRLLSPVSFLVALLLAVTTAAPAVGQDADRTGRAFVPHPQVRGMGDAAVAVSPSAAPLFYNPAHLPHVESKVRIGGLSGALSGGIRDQVRFYQDRVDPAIQAQFDLPSSELRSLYDDAFDLGRRPTRGSATLLLPAFTARRGAWGFGGSLALDSRARYRVGNAGLGIPEVDVVGRTDASLLLATGVDLTRSGLPGLSAGVTVKATRRYLTLKQQALDTFSTDDSAVLLKGTSLGLDVGLRYALPFDAPGQWTVGLAVYDLWASDFNYEEDGSLSDMPIIGGMIDEDDATPLPETVARETAYARERYGLAPSYRVGAAYALDRVGFLDDVQLALDWQGYTSAPRDGSFFTHWHAGAQARVAGPLSVRAGLSQGYPTGGLGLSLGPAQIDYAVYGIEEGRTPGQIQNYVHTLQVAFYIR